MGRDKSTDARRQAWAQLERAAESLEQAGGLIVEAHALLDRFCSSRDQDNWDQAFAWRISELQQAGALCRQIADHVKKSATE